MKIAFIRKNYSPFGGAEKFLANLIHAFSQKDHEVHIFSHSWQGNSISKNVIFHRVPFIKGASFLKVISFALLVKQRLKKERFDVIFSLERTFYQDIYRAGDGCHRQWLHEKDKTKNILKKIITFLNPLHLTILIIEKKLFRKNYYEMIIANSKRGKQEIINSYNVPDDKIEVVYNGVDTDKYCLENRERFYKKIRDSLGIGTSEIVLLFIGSGFKRKGLLVLLKAVQILINEGRSSIKLLVAGRGSIKKYKKLAHRFGIRDKVFFLGPRSQVQDLYGASDIFILPTLYEPFSNACIEAMASGLPVITTRINGVSELINNHKNGLVLENPEDSIELAALIKQIEGKKKRTLMGNSARQTAQGFSLTNQNEKIIQLIEKVLLHKKKAR